MTHENTPLNQEIYAAFSDTLEKSSLPGAAQEAIKKDYREATATGTIIKTLFKARQQVAKLLNTGEYTSLGVPPFSDTEGYKTASSDIAKAFDDAQTVLKKCMHMHDGQRVHFREMVSTPVTNQLASQVR